MTLFAFFQYNEELHYVEPCLNGTLVQADVTNKDVSSFPRLHFSFKNDALYLAPAQGNLSILIVSYTVSVVNVSSSLSLSNPLSVPSTLLLKNSISSKLFNLCRKSIYVQL